ncbi:hypothetical protein JIX56_22670 [Streptomyces sp. CA-210063]|uniref:hypothetical protein n=1 Tax=Streptomyces sp. CA-210063 TaxID=2801029 RepID=UPI00214B291D|nr:hypothetical protein [Streptomyces sp. CA-210063]UUU32480.1 hypothetical protein JIX56_22670 [Streptomyces sp. CA-210063]
MMKSTAARKTASFLTTALLVGGAMAAGTGTASAAPSITWGTVVFTESGDRTISIYADGVFAGSGEWQKDPSGSNTGDTLVAWDPVADGYGIEAHLSTGRIATTRGHNSPYEVKVSGNLPEGNKYTMWVCLVRGDYRGCTSKYSVTA